MSFKNTLKSTRDGFDAYMPNGRVGWHRDGTASNLTKQARSVFDEWENKSDAELWEAVRQLVLASSHASLGTAQPPIDLAPPERHEIIESRIIRDTAATLRIKDLYEYRCQLCGLRIEALDGGFYCEVHHVRPLGGDHHGLDHDANMIVLCPNHHAMFDLSIPEFITSSSVAIAGCPFKLHSLHDLAEANWRYHNQLHSAIHAIYCEPAGYVE